MAFQIPIFRLNREYIPAQSVCMAVFTLKLYANLMISNQYTKEQLLNKDENELRSIASEMNLPERSRTSLDDFIYDILDAQAEAATSTAPVVEAAPRRRRIAIKASDHIYSASTSGESERFDNSRDERAAKRAVAAKAKEADALATQALLDLGGVVDTPKRKRGRPSKEDLAAQKALEAAQSIIAEAQSKKTTPEEATPTPQEEEVVAQPDAPMMEEQAKTVPEAAAPSSTNETEEELPAFILVQMQQSQAAAETSTKETKTPDLNQLAQVYRQRNEERKASQQDTKSRRNEAAELAAQGADFIIVKDVPVVSTTFETLSDAPTNDNSSYGESSLARFRRFKDDMVLQARRSNETAELTPPSTAQQDIVLEATGVLELDQQGVGFLRSADYHYMPSPDDVYVSPAQVRHYMLKTGDVIEAKVRAPRSGEQYYVLINAERINGLTPEQLRDRTSFEHLTPLFPNEQFKLSNGGKTPLACRMVDLFSPIGKGQRALIVAQPKTGKTILMKQIANAIAANYPDTYLMMLLIDERPEEVTDMERTVNAEVIASTFDEPASRHVRVAQMVLEKAKRMVECGHDVVIFLDSITRLARAFNTVAPTSGKILTGGVDATALQRPKRFFGAARNIENGGSLTIIATALIDTGSKMDEVIFEEFKGTGNMELQLDRGLANKRMFPAINLIQSSTRRDDLLLDEMTLNRMYILRKFMADMSSFEAMDFVHKRIGNTLSNEEFLSTMNG